MRSSCPSTSSLWKKKICHNNVLKFPCLTNICSISSVLFLFLNMICEGFFKNNAHWNIRFYVRSVLNLGRSLHASLLWVWKKGDGRCACVFVAWGGISETKTTDASGHFLVKLKEEPKKRNSSLNQLQRRRRKKVLRVLQRSPQQLLQGA